VLGGDSGLVLSEQHHDLVDGHGTRSGNVEAAEDVLSLMGAEAELDAQALKG
jgi:hypothetical protein